MVRFLFKQPNGLYGCYSTVTDSFIFCNATKEKYIEMRLEELKEDLEDMFAKEDTSPWKNTAHADILNSDIMFKKIFYYNWNEKDLVTNIGMLRAAGYSKEKLDELDAKWTELQKEREAEEYE